MRSQHDIDAATMEIKVQTLGSGYIQLPPQKRFEGPRVMQPPTIAHLDHPEYFYDNPHVGSQRHGGGGHQGGYRGPQSNGYRGSGQGHGHQAGYGATGGPRGPGHHQQQGYGAGHGNTAHPHQVGYPSSNGYHQHRPAAQNGPVAPSRPGSSHPQPYHNHTSGAPRAGPHAIPQHHHHNNHHHPYQQQPQQQQHHQPQSQYHPQPQQQQHHHQAPPAAARPQQQPPQQQYRQQASANAAAVDVLTREMATKASVGSGAAAAAKAPAAQPAAPAAPASSASDDGKLTASQKKRLRKKLRDQAKAGP